MINLADYTYNLPDERIARFPVEPRHDSKLLVYQQGQISHHQFKEIGTFLPAKPLLVFNNSKVIPARIIFQKPSGAMIEIFLLHPVAPTTVINLAMQATDSCVWACMIGNKKRWKSSVSSDEKTTFEILQNSIQASNGTATITLAASLVDVEQNHVQFTWENQQNEKYVQDLKSFTK